MILSLTSDLPGFKGLTFHEGLNVVLADRTDASTERQTRNSAGKTSVIEVMHFLLGSAAGKSSIFQSPALFAFTFHARLRLGPHEITVSRSGADANRMLLLEEDAAKIAAPLTRDKSEAAYLTVERWREILGHYWFGLPRDPKGTEFEQSFVPGFRSLVSYFIRRNAGGAFAVPVRQHEKQNAYDWQVNLSYLIGLDWRIPRAIEQLKVSTAALADLRKAIKEGAFGKLFGSVGEIRPEIQRIEARIERLRAAIAAFEVAENYRERAAEAATARRRIQSLGFERMRALQTIAHLEAAVAEERAPEYAALERLYRAADVQLPGIVLAKMDDVASFQRSVSENRRVHLGGQISETRASLALVDAEMTALDESQSAIMAEIAGKGALEDFTMMAEEIGTLGSEVELLREKLRNAEILEGKKSLLLQERASLLQRLQADHRERGDALRSATLMIDRSITELYDDRYGNLIVEATPKGPEFRISIQGDGNRGGIDRMEIFCFDLMLYETAAERFNGGPGLLVHDSHLFDGVDPRQVRTAIALGHRTTVSRGGQYIIALNSEVLDVLDLGSEIDLDAAVLRPRLSDDETGGLFGIRFDTR
ncbi:MULTISPECIES: DUF2326 domain-containing protein [Methylobacteriaceae]|uniref:ABC-three component system protein n=1 Tax=Methylobacteriaceae TaxID=119045 RepID=UPI000CDB9EF4|nr:MULTISPECIES: DUF2326 domain-containing protein [Methylobacteriaceae]MCP1549374.1 uncharacterized protein YydD (DUF2326 family) [Methylorubrum zatmanii]MCP1554013.1 uncharacterized protein YydD (DUF2326 family) [Methylorubrum extorquens]MCP1579676.1 uncharacterized protein YydD (DUF2326 family) [Methylorubrum extorquens]POR41031.1 hypothetical protein CRT23_20560 [Methylobacterium sp. V23]